MPVVLKTGATQRKILSEMIRRYAHHRDPDKEEPLEQALQILTKAEMSMRLATDSRLPGEDRQQTEGKAGTVIQEFTNYYTSDSLRRSESGIQRITNRNGSF